MKTRLIYKKNIYINEKDLNKKFLIYNGKSFYKLIVSSEMIGYRFGEFVFTRKFFKFRK